MPKHLKTFYGIFLSDAGYVYIKRKPKAIKLIHKNYYYINRDDFFHARVRVDFTVNRVNSIHYNKCYNEGGLRNYQIFPLVDIFNRYPEIDPKIVPNLVKLVNDTWGGDFKVPNKKDFLME